MIPNVIHYLYFGGKPFSLVHYLSIKSAHDVNRPSSINFYYSQEPTGEYWELAKSYLHTYMIKPPMKLFGENLIRPEHQADIARLEILIEKGGIYLDMDVICVRPFTDLLTYKFVIGQEGVDGEYGLCNGVIMAEQGSYFARKWLEGFDERTTLWDGFKKEGWFLEYWNQLSVRYPQRLAALFPEHIHIEGFKSFHWPLWYGEHLDLMFNQTGSEFSEAYCHHLWQRNSWEKYLSMLTIHDVITVDTNFNLIARRFLKEGKLNA